MSFRSHTRWWRISLTSVDFLLNGSIHRTSALMLWKLLKIVRLSWYSLIVLVCKFLSADIKRTFTYMHSKTLPCDVKPKSIRMNRESERERERERNSKQSKKRIWEIHTVKHIHKQTHSHCVYEFLPVCSIFKGALQLFARSIDLVEVLLCYIRCSILFFFLSRLAHTADSLLYQRDRILSTIAKMKKK